MKNIIKIISVVLLAFWGREAFAIDKVVYGVDNRQDVFQSPTAYAGWARSTCDDDLKWKFKI